MRLRTKISILLFSVVLLGACATGPKYEEIQSTLSALDPANGRIFFYRQSVLFGDGLQPKVWLNGEVIGQSQPGGFFFVDRPPGDYETVMSTETEKKLSFRLEAGQIRYVKMSIGLGILVGRIIPSLVEDSVGLEELSGLSYTGTL